MNNDKVSVTGWVLRWLLAMVAVLAVGVAQAQTAVEAVSGSLQGGSEVLRIDFSQPLAAVPAGFSIQSPARIALDVPGAVNGEVLLDVEGCGRVAAIVTNESVAAMGLAPGVRVTAVFKASSVILAVLT